MTRKVLERPIDSKAARAKLKPGDKPYYRSLGPRLQIGYRRGADARRWVMRTLCGKGQYKVESIGYADDTKPADGIDVLTYDKACERARELHRKRIAGGDDRSSAP